MKRSLGYDSPDLMASVPMGTEANPGEAEEYVAFVILGEFCHAIAESGMTRAERQHLVDDALRGVASMLSPQIGLEEEGEVFVKVVRSAYDLSCTMAGRHPDGAPGIDTIIEALARSEAEWAGDTTHREWED